MKIDGALVLEFRNTGVYGSRGEVYIHIGTTAQRVYEGPGAHAFYHTMKQYIQARHGGSGDWFEWNTQHGLQWRERGRSGITYEPVD
jgi:hypothetical protein